MARSSEQKPGYGNTAALSIKGEDRAIHQGYVAPSSLNGATVRGRTRASCDIEAGISVYTYMVYP